MRVQFDSCKADRQVCAGRPRPARPKGDLEVARRPGGPPYKKAILGIVTLFASTFAANNPANVTFTDVTTQSGIKFVHNAGKAGKKYLPETLGAGCAFLD